MKSIVQYLKESFETIDEGKDQYFRFVFGDLENADDTIDSIISLAKKAEIYYEKIDGGVKVKGKDSNRDKFGSIVDVIQQYVEGLRDKEDVDSEKVERLASQLSKLTDWIDSESEEENEETKEKKEKKDKKDDEDE